ncbi:MAG: pyridoxal phosphate-dependent class II aminotransferase [Bacteroidia bacterium]|nr:pyridoxal phosphate-dependent class II aminotransferase [Bacteroidia bacterium]
MINGHGDDMHGCGVPIVSNFSSNVFAQLDNGALKRYLAEHLDFIDVYPQPEAESLRQALADKMELTADEVCVTNGATEAIYLIAQAHAGVRSAVLMPTFSEYADACVLHRHRLTVLYDLKEMPEETQLCWLCNPNNPTGTVVEKTTLKAFIEAHPQTCFLVDQSYEWFTEQPLFTAREAADMPNLLLLHSMTKQFKIAGIRLGYLTGSAALIETIRRQRMPWSVNNLAIVAGHFLLGQDNGLDLSAYLKETQRFRAGLEALGVLTVWPTETHILLCQLRFGKASALKTYLAHEHGILIRDASNFQGLNDSFFRVATQTAEENDQLIKAIAQWIAS